jgi:hypothetical protein
MIEAGREATGAKLRRGESRRKDPSYERIRRREKNRELRRMYGITLDEFETMREAQDGWCANLGCPNRATDVDHCHSTGKVRGFLCHRCNVALGYLGDDVNRILLLASYLRDHQIAESP